MENAMTSICRLVMALVDNHRDDHEEETSEIGVRLARQSVKLHITP